MIRTIMLTISLSLLASFAFSQTLSVENDSINIKRNRSLADTSTEKGEAEFEVLVNALGKVIQAEPVQSTLSKELTQLYRQDLIKNVTIDHKTGKSLKTRIYYEK